MRSIDAECVADELVRIFARVGIPEEILTDQSSNFTSKLLSEIYRLIHIHPIRTSPYHPPTKDSVVSYVLGTEQVVKDGSSGSRTPS